jgi:hypothetical protein
MIPLDWNFDDRLPRFANERASDTKMGLERHFGGAALQAESLP